MERNEKTKGSGQAMDKMFGKTPLGLVLTAGVVVLVQILAFVKDMSETSPASVLVEVQRQGRAIDKLLESDQATLRILDRQTLILERMERSKP